MSDRTTAEIVADLRSHNPSSGPQSVRETNKGDLRNQAADRLVELDAAATHHDSTVKFYAEAAARAYAIDALRPPCPTRGGCEGFEDGIWMNADICLNCHRHKSEHPCPENGGNCDGKATIERLVAVFNAVHGPGWTEGEMHAINLLRSVR